MTGIIVTGHGIFSEGMVSAIDLLGGKQEYLKYVNFTASMSTGDLNSQLEGAVLELDQCDHILILCDLVGGSPFKEAAVIASKRKDITVIGGANMAMLIEAVFSRSVCDDGHELAERCVAALVQSAQIFVPVEENIDTEEEEL